MDSDDQQRGSRLILPPVARPKQTIASIQQIMSILTRKKEEYQQALKKQEPADQEYSLKYARCETEINAFDRTMRGKELNEEEFLGRGSLIQHSFYKKAPKRKNKLIAAQIHSTIEPGRATANSNAAKRQETPLVSQSRYKSLQIGEQLHKKNELAPQKEVINQERERETVQSQINVNQFVLPISPSTQQKNIRPKIKTEIQKDSILTKENSDQSSEKIIIQKFKEHITDMKRGSKTNERLERTIKSLESFNPFFRKIQRVIGVCLLRMGKVKQKPANSILYRMDQPQSHFFIILSGEIKITGRFGMHKVCEAGETLLQEILEMPLPKDKLNIPVALEKAKATEDSWVLQIERDEFKKLQRELNKFGFRQGLNQMKTLLKRNSIVKNWLRNKFKLLQKR